MNTAEEKPVRRQSGAFSAGIRKRLTWRPSAVHAAESLASEIMNQAEPFARNAARLSAWPKQLSRRARPLSGWPPQALEFHSDSLLAEGRTTEAAAREFGVDAAASANKIPPVKTQRYAVDSVVSRPEPAVAIMRATRTTRAAPRSQADKQASGGHDSAIARRHWRPSFSAERRVPGDLSRSQSGALSPVADEPSINRLITRAETSGALPLAAVEQIPRTAPLMTTSAALGRHFKHRVSSTPRREVPGGFPVIQTPLRAMRETGPITEERTASRLEPRSGIDLTQPFTYTQRTEINEARLSSTSPQAIAAQDSPPEAEGAIERLIRHTVMPTSLPGLDLRLLAPEEQPRPIRRPPDSDQGERPRIAGSAPMAPAADPPPAPQLNINEVAEKVYQTLRRRQQLERERKGSY